ncbi:MAG: serine/threonine-protein kinase [Nannocystaceae bacterium]|nr:serine/threonine-protein kinase [Nannocystaceae bacterium]
MGTRDEPEKISRDVEVERARELVRAQLFQQPEVPVRVGRFELRKRIGEGGMGVVFSARDPELDRDVAIKLLHSEEQDEDRANRLLREAKAMARLAHPNVIAVYEAGTEDGQVYLAMEFVRGLDLRAWLLKEPRSWRTILSLLIDAAHGLAAAHAAGLVHRDFKPENVLVTEDGRAKVADFGLARPAQSGVSTETEETTQGTASRPLETLTKTGVVLGTPAYLPPEALEGGPTDARGDQFSFCVAAYEALVGRRPFAGKSLQELQASIRRGEVRPMPTDRPIPRALRRLLARGLQPRPEDRHPSMRHLVRALQAQQTRRRTRVLAAVGSGLLGLFAVQAWPEPASECTGAPAVWAETWSLERGVTMAASLGSSAPPSADSTAKQVGDIIDAYGERWVAAHRDTCMATRVRGEQSLDVLDLQMACLDVRRDSVGALVDSLMSPNGAAVDRAVVAARRLPAIDTCRAVDTRGWIEPLPDDPQLREQVLQLKADLSRAHVLADLDQRDAAQELYTSVQAGADALGYRPLMAQARNAITEGSPATKATRDIVYEALFHAEASGYAEGARAAWTRLVTMHAYNGEYAEADRAASHALALLERTGGAPARLAELLNLRAFAQVEQSNFDLAVMLMEEAVETIEATGDEPPDLASHLNSLGTIYTLAERNEDALQTYERAYALMLTSVGKDQEGIAHVMMNLGRVAARLDRLDESNAWYERSLATYDRIGASQSLRAVFALNNLGQNYGDQGQYAEAIATIERALAAQIQNVGKEHRMLVRMRRGLSQVYLDAGDLPKAIDECEHALQIAEATFGDEHDETASTRRRLGLILLTASDPVRARPLLERALEGHQKPDIPAEHKATSQYWLFRALMNDPSERTRARALATEAIPVLAENGNEERASELRAWLERTP